MAKDAPGSAAGKSASLSQDAPFANNLSTEKSEQRANRPSESRSCDEPISVEQALAESEARFRTVADAAPVMIWMSDVDKLCNFFNKGWLDFTGRSLAQELGNGWTAGVYREDLKNCIEVYGNAFDVRKPFTMEYRLRRKDGEYRWILDSGTPRYDIKGVFLGYIGASVDITERRKTEDKLEESRLDLEHRVTKRTADLTATNQKLQAEIERRVKLEQEILRISEREQRRIGQDLHDSLCQELAAAAFFLQSTATKLGPKRREESAALTEAAQIVNANVGLARDLARGLHPVELSASGLRNALAELAYRIDQNVPCRFHCPRPVRVQDETLALNLYRIVQEAAANAVQHGKPKDIAISLTRDRRGITLVICDRGKGMSVTTGHEGLGINIMKYRANAIGGSLTIDSKPNDGTTITCHVPSR